MTEAAQVLNQTNEERSKLKNSAYHKKNGSAVAKLGNKRMSWQEIQSKHGPVQTYTEGFTTYEEFKKMPPDLEAEYVNNLCSKYHIRHEEVSSILFELGENDLMSRLKIKGVEKKILKIKRTDVTEDAITNFKNDVDDWRKKSETAKIIDLSEAQRRRDIIKHGEFISYEEYKTFSDFEMVDYINSLVDRYDVGRSVISKNLFGKSGNILDMHFRTKNLSQMLHTTKPCAPLIRKEKTKAFENAVKAWKGENVVEEKTEVMPEPAMEEPESVTRDILASIIGESEPEKHGDIIAKIPNVDKPEETAAEELRQDISEVYIPMEEEPQAETAITSPVIETNTHSTVFSANYRSTGMDCDELDALKLMFKNKLVEVCITVRTI